MVNLKNPVVHIVWIFMNTILPCDQEFAKFIKTTLVHALFSCNNEKLEVSNQTFIIILKAYTSPNPLPPNVPFVRL